MYFHRGSLALGLAALCCLTPPALAVPVVGLGFSGASGSLPGNFEIGYEFSIAAPRLVTGIGVINRIKSNVLTNNVGTTSFGIWNSTGTTQFFSGIASFNAIQIGDFSYVAITPFLLGPGTYVVGAGVGGLLEYGHTATVTPGSGITIITDRFSNSPGSFPGTDGGGGSTPIIGFADLTFDEIPVAAGAPEMDPTKTSLPLVFACILLSAARSRRSNLNL